MLVGHDRCGGRRWTQRIMTRNVHPRRLGDILKLMIGLIAAGPNGTCKGIQRPADQRSFIVQEYWWRALHPHLIDGVCGDCIGLDLGAIVIDGIEVVAVETWQ